MKEQMGSEAMDFTSELAAGVSQNLDPRNKSIIWSPGWGCPEPRVQGHTWVGLGKEVWAQHNSPREWGHGCFAAACSSCLPFRPPPPCPAWPDRSVPGIWRAIAVVSPALSALTDQQGSKSPGRHNIPPWIPVFSTSLLSSSGLGKDSGLRDLTHMLLTPSHSHPLPPGSAKFYFCASL